MARDHRTLSKSELIQSTTWVQVRISKAQYAGAFSASLWWVTQCYAAFVAGVPKLLMTGTESMVTGTGQMMNN